METHVLMQLQKIQQDGIAAYVPLLLLIRPDSMLKKKCGEKTMKFDSLRQKKKSITFEDREAKCVR